MSDGAEYSLEGLDRVIHERARLAILSSLAANPSGLVFNDLKRVCALTDGNLSRQITTLVEAGLVGVEKVEGGRRPVTLVKMTGRGRGRFLAYVGELEKVIAAAAGREAGAGKTVARGRVAGAGGGGVGLG